MYKIDTTSYRSVKGFNSRIRFLVLHYTACNFIDSINALTGGTVSAHYSLPDPTDQTYINAGFTGMTIFNLVDETQRAWHAGVSSWAGRSNLNDTSIGIEMVNLATDNKGVFTFPPYNPVQIDAVIELLQAILNRYPDITPPQVLGHSDISAGRKSDPGAAFPWKELYKAGVGAWYDEATKQNYEVQFDNLLPTQANVLANLSRYGYDVSGANVQKNYENLIRAFQLHFRAKTYDGVLDPETAAILYALVEKYFP
ncbi:N-acetylmuramoyl-L-alanine amidase [Pseudomonas fluorescens]|uniref:N-acetylmuramoyl-L-alanine amidase n=1 Tax=Pseudomonas fluorescens TaxID=294 RepID=A0A1T2Y2Y6_PSEFL|nr:N-acetylmuramoyl-L-alanine amidase [Pseudomonas fluorescens]OPA86507.1 N-acetylmuramoyl-L-alanine amidase [Pseudomonas fluorescens]